MTTLDAAPPFTSNQYAAALIQAAAARCYGCRAAWRLDGWLHRSSPRPRMECRAKSERQALRDIAASNRAAERLS